MKKTDLEKLKGLKINARLKRAATPDRFARGAGAGGAKPVTNPLIEKLLKKGLADDETR